MKKLRRYFLYTLRRRQDALRPGYCILASNAHSVVSLDKGSMKYAVLWTAAQQSSEWQPRPQEGLKIRVQTQQTCGSHISQSVTCGTHLNLSELVSKGNCCDISHRLRAGFLVTAHPGSTGTSTKPLTVNAAQPCLLSAVLTWVGGNPWQTRKRREL